MSTHFRFAISISVSCFHVVVVVDVVVVVCCCCSCPSPLYTRSASGFYFLYICRYTLFEAQRELWLQINESSVFLWRRTKLRDPVGDA